MSTINSGTTSVGYERWMLRAIELAEIGETKGEVPVGAVLVWQGKVIGEGWNQPISHHDATAHAEIIALRAATKKLQNYRLPEQVTLFVTLEPCPMCAGAMVNARVARVVFGVSDPRAGAAGSVFNILNADKLNHRAEIVPEVLASRCNALLTNFFRKRR